MFGNDKKSAGGRKPEALSANLNTIAKGTVINGQIESAGIIRIDGTVKGTVKTRAKIAVGRSGHVEGDIYCDEADIEGRIDGTLSVDQKLTIRSHGKVTGDIRTGKLVVEPGAEFNGNCRMGEAAQVRKPQHGASEEREGPSIAKKAV
jgi:cytoskeletal protein CcmA (bactofilin family)